MPHFRNIALVVLVVVLALPPVAYAAPFERPLRAGDEGEDVTELQIRIAGWFPRDDQRRLKITGTFDTKTENALKAFQEHYGLAPDGTAGPQVYEKLAELTDEDGSTANFDWDEFDQNYNPDCSNKANRYAGTFKGGPASKDIVKEYVRQLMWRLEALRAKEGDNPIGINSGYRSTAYNKCVGGAEYSQHLYGAAVDVKVADVDNHETRAVAKGSQFSGIACYSGFSHNHLDIRLDNADLEAAWYWYWPEQDEHGRDIADDGKICYGEKKERNARMLRAARGASTPYIPTLADVLAFDSSVENYAGLAD